MATATALASTFPTDWTLADLQAHLGDVSAERIRLFPLPGTATEEDVIQTHDHGNRLCELVDGVLVEKTMGWYESLLAVILASRIHRYLNEHPLGMVLGADGTLKILPDMVRIPDVCFVRKERLPRTPFPRRPIPPLVPNLAVEVLSKSNTKAEMERKLHDYFEAGVELVWYIDPETRTARVFTEVDQATDLDEAGVLDGGTVLPGFQLSLRQLFGNALAQATGSQSDE